MTQVAHVTRVVENRVLSDQVHARIKQMIERGELRPGQRVNKRELELLMGVSQTPINDALSRLVGEQFILLEKRKGFSVKVYSCQELVDLFALRAGIEGIAARLICESAEDAEIRTFAGFFSDYRPPFDLAEVARYTHEDVRFHTHIVELCRNPMLIGPYERFGYMLKANQHGLARPPQETIVEHHAIINAILTRDGVRAQQELTEHIMRSRTAWQRGCTDSHTVQNP